MKERDLYKRALSLCDLQPSFYWASTVKPALLIDMGNEDSISDSNPGEDVTKE